MSPDRPFVDDHEPVAPLVPLRRRPLDLKTLQGLRRQAEEDLRGVAGEALAVAADRGLEALLSEDFNLQTHATVIRGVVAAAARFESWDDARADAAEALELYDQEPGEWMDRNHVADWYDELVDGGNDHPAANVLLCYYAALEQHMR